MQNPLLGLQLPYDMKPDTLLQWSSFPSDNATLFFGLATALWMVSKRLGLFAYSYVLLMIVLPRIYLGIHFPTDIIAGALLGIGAVSLANVMWLRKSATRPALDWMNRFPAGGYVLLFLFSFEVAEEFNSLRQVAMLGYHNIAFALHALR
jgi:undecaprenyl-diphosphatase